MILVDSKKKFLLKILGYEFDGATSYHDSNWLNVSIVVEDGDLHWSANDPCLSTMDLVRLKDWLLDLYHDSEKGIYFTEHELAFEFDRSSSVLSVLLVYGFHPNAGKGDDDEDYKLDFHMDQRKISALVSDVDNWLDKYPFRKEQS
jgi:hypothetical protein